MALPESSNAQIQQMKYSGKMDYRYERVFEMLTM
jgi:hypothetical protein